MFLFLNVQNTRESFLRQTIQQDVRPRETLLLTRGQTQVNFEIHQDRGSVMKYDDSLLDDSVLRNSLVGHIILDDTC